MTMAYPYLSDVLPIPTFGTLVAVAMLAAALCLRRELRRLHACGQLGHARRRVRNADGSVTLQAVAPEQIVPDLLAVVMVAGIAGARLFHIFEHLDAFRADPWGMIFTRSGLSVFGGLILGFAAGLILVRRWKLPAAPVLDAIAPSLMLGYAIGRIGDWGIAADMALKPAWLPQWLWAQTYEHNIVGEVIALPGVYPTPLYETAMGLLCFALLWGLRRHPFAKGWLFSLYLLLAGVERCLIEHIRQNPILDFGIFRATQAEFISTLFVVAGLAGLFLLSRRTPNGRNLRSASM
jgi:phosphatidylglycerol:prolipoprotein diacylglycerol transferase